MNPLLLSQAALNEAAKSPKNRVELRKARDQAKALRAKLAREHAERMGDLDALVRRIGIALGEVDA